MATAIGIIANYLGIRDGNIVNSILTLLGIGVSYGGEITNQVNIYKSGLYQYNATRAGYAYDTTRYMNYVRVIIDSDVGEFAGGYNNMGEFDWVRLVDPPSFDDRYNSYSSIADTTIYNYNADIVVNKACSLYYPD